MIGKCSVCGRTHAVNKGQVQMPSLFCAKHYTGNAQAEFECSKFATDTAYVVSTKVAEQQEYLAAVDGHIDMTDAFKYAQGAGVTTHVVDSISKLGELLYPVDAPPQHVHSWPQEINFNTEPSVLVPINKAISEMIADHGVKPGTMANVNYRDVEERILAHHLDVKACVDAGMSPYDLHQRPTPPVAKRRPSMFQLAQLVSGPGHETRPWFIIETFYSSDGPRTRMCAGKWATRIEAQAQLEEKEARA